MSLDKKVGEKIATICKEKHMSLTQVSILTGINYKTLWSYCNGSRGLDFDTLVKILKVLDVRLDEFTKDLVQ